MSNKQIEDIINFEDTDMNSFFRRSESTYRNLRRMEIMCEDTLAYESNCEDDDLSFEGTTLKADKHKIYKCPICRKPYTSKGAMYNHIENTHGDMIPEGMSVAQFAFNIRNKKTHGTCIVCKTNKTTWNEKAERYNSFCSDACKAKYVANAKKNMIKKYGKPHILDDPDQQRKMINNRSISGKYLFSTDNVIVPYNSSYEKDFLEFLDAVCDLNGADVTQQMPAITYNLKTENGLEEKMYIPDYYLPNFNLMVEIKDGGDNPNKHYNGEGTDNKARELAKDEAMRIQDKFNYIKIVNKKYDEFLVMIRIISTEVTWDDPDFNKLKPLIWIP